MFYVIEITNGDSKVSSKAVYEYTTLNEAVAAYHTKMGTAMRSDLYDSELVMVVDSEGAVYRSEKYTKPVAEEPVEA